MFGSSSVRAKLTTLYRVGDFFVVRSPFFPVERFLGWQEGLPEEGSRRTELVSRLVSAFDDPALRDALFFASPEIDETLPQPDRDIQISPKLQRSLLRYFLRATGRETPFGLFAGHSLGVVGDEDRFELSARGDYRARTRISIAHLNRVMTALAARADARDEVPHEPNPSLWEVQGNYRIALEQRREVEGQTRFTSSIVEVIRTPEVARALALARRGRSLSDIARDLHEPGREPSEWLDFCRDLSAEQLLVPTWLPSTSGIGAAAVCAASLESHPQLAEARTVLVESFERLAAADESGIGAASASYRAVRQRLAACEASSPTPQPLQTDLIKPAPQLSMTAALAERFLTAAELLQRTGVEQPDPVLTAFRRRFVARYDRRLIPLTEALDADLGVGFDGADTHVAEALVAGLPGTPREEPRFVDPADRARLRLLERALSQRSRVVELDEELLGLFPPGNGREPQIESFSIMARLARGDDGELMVVAPEISTPTAVSLLGRFCETDLELRDAVSRHAEMEQALAGETLLADVVFCPSDDTANVVARPVLRRYEIECGGKSGAPFDRRIPISDLLLGAEGPRLQLYSRRLGKRVAIRFGNAHNHTRSSLPTIYRFLGALQHQDDALVCEWSWGTLEGSAFLPRVVSGSTVLALARYRIPHAEWAPVVSAKPAEMMDRLRALRATRDLPRWLTRSEGDRRLVVDLDNELCVEELVHEARQRVDLVLEELFPGHHQLVLQGPEGSYAGQFVVPFIRRKALATRAVPQSLSHSSLRVRPRSHAPGSEWLYVRVYAGKSRHTELLRELQEHVVAPSLGSAAKLWFYLPYSDPEPHLRIRIHGCPIALRTEVLSRLERTLATRLDDGSVFRIELGTYEPEVERYGGPRGMQLAERLFFADSEASIDLLDLAGDDDVRRWQFALVGIDRLLSDCGVRIERRAALARLASEAYGQEAGATTATWKAIGVRYRRHAAALSLLLWAPDDSDHFITRMRQVLSRRSAKIHPIWAEIHECATSGELGVDIEELALTFAHIHAVRMLGITGRAHELVLYDFLRRQYAARLSVGREKGDERALDLS